MSIQSDQLLRELLERVAKLEQEVRELKLAKEVKSEPKPVRINGSR